MNGPKLVAEIIAAVIVLGCCYGLVTEAVPDQYPPVEVATEGNFTMGQDGADLTLGIPDIKVDSHMPSDLTNVSLELYLDSGSGDYHLATVDVGVIAAEAETTITRDNLVDSDSDHVSDGLIHIPSYVVLASLAANSDGGTVTTPAIAKLHFEYLEFQGDSLLDMGLNLRFDIGASGTLTVTAEGDDAVMKAELENGSFLYALQEVRAAVCDPSGNCTVRVGDCAAGLSFNIGQGGEVTFTASGQDGRTAYQLLDDYASRMADGDTADVTVTGSPDTTRMTKTQMSAFADMVEQIYGVAA